MTSSPPDLISRLCVDLNTAGVSDLMVQALGSRTRAAFGPLLLISDSCGGEPGRRTEPGTEHSERRRSSCP
jgi:hypothetical protein